MVHSLRGRLLLTYLGLIVIGFGGLTLLAGWQLANSAYTDFAATLRVNAAILASSLAAPERVEHGEHEEREDRVVSLPTPSAVNLALFQRTAESVNGRALLLDEHGRILVDKGSQQNAVGQVSPFAISTNGGATYVFDSDEAGVAQIVSTVPTLGRSEGSGYIQLAAPAAKPQTMVRQRLMALLGGFVLFVLLGIGISLWLLNSLTQPLARLRATALAMAGGDLQQRVPTPGQDEIGAVAQAFNQMATQVEAMVAEQRAFASNASHELRTPLTTIRLRTEPLLSGELDPATTQRYLTEIHEEVVRMAGLVDDLILLSRLDAHRLAVGEEQVDALRLVRRLVQTLSTQATTKGISLQLAAPSEALLPVQANLNHAHVVVRNLLDNAIKYTPAGGQIVISLAQQAEMVEIQIADNGQGIAAEDLPNLTKRFYRADKAHGRQSDGIGLGLALVESIVALYGGHLTITSAGLGQGTTVTVWWPVQQLATDPAVVVPGPSIRSEAAPGRVPV